MKKKERIDVRAYELILRERAYLGAAGVHLVLHGHTHVPRDETDARGVRWLNPGCITRPNRGARASFGWLTLVKDTPPDWRLELL